MGGMPQVALSQLLAELLPGMFEDKQESCGMRRVEEGGVEAGGMQRRAGDGR